MPTELPHQISLFLIVSFIIFFVVTLLYGWRLDKNKKIINGKPNYIFEKSAKSTGIRDITISVLIALSLIGLTITMVVKDEVSYILLLFLWLFLGSFSIFWFKSGCKYVSSKESWKVSINEEHIKWDSPQEDSKIGSFSYKLTDIAYSETRQEYGPDNSSSWYYELALKSGVIHEIPQHTGINVRKILKVLELFDIKHKFERISKKKARLAK